MAAKFPVIFALLGLLAGGCTTVAFPPDYSPSKVHVGSRSTPREALELFQYTIWEERTDISHPILSEKTRAEYGPLTFWVGLGFTFPLCETDPNILKEDWISTEEFFKFAKISHIPIRKRSPLLCKVKIEYGDGYYSCTYPVIMILERDGWAVGLKEMEKEWSKQ